MPRVLLPTLLILISGAARAEDFTGFYAGLNAGYARGHERDRPVTAPRPVSGGGTYGRGPDLPPSALEAAASMRRGGGTIRPDTSAGR
ncbi:hypothetical protein [Methylobacterium sp. J-070]|uniref:hypothetical protein n=1 Tax=Methylobacterium sp. J-070 TaxID=2836650 RepID=UPI001FBBF51B|nr:hypothetical protein [Methylobacterium sp. J-070]MCJ2051543.1 hypothetical protein [Methylobacterium sp. J-070]